ncbi:MAG: hypothetical protein Q9209_007700 [Squamulea sp. 1 TL-2023]
MPSSEPFPDSPSIDNLMARRTGSRRHVTIPGFAQLPNSKQLAICARLEQLENAPAVDGDALHARLLSLASVSVAATSLPSPSPSSPSTVPTSPPDLEAETERDRLLEVQARNRLELDGCPPCYPANPSFLVQDPPKSHSGIISYWEAFPSSEGGVLHAQWEDWQKFRNFQQRTRQHYAQHQIFSQFTDAVRKRMRRHHLPEDVHLHPDPGQQNQLDTWVEFQNYHLHMHEQLEGEAQVEMSNLRNAQRSKDAAISEDEHAASCVNGYRVRLESAIQRMELHEQLLLPWIEQRRMEKVNAQSTTEDDAGSYDDQPDTIRRTPQPDTGKRTSKVRSVLNPVRSAVSKPTRRKRSLRSQRSEILREIENPADESSTSLSNTPEVPDLRVFQAANKQKCASTPIDPVSQDKATEACAGSKNITVEVHTPGTIKDCYNAMWTGVKEA